MVLRPANFTLINPTNNCRRAFATVVDPEGDTSCVWISVIFFI